MKIHVCLQEENGDQQAEKSTTENNVEKEEETGENQNEEEEETGENQDEEEEDEEDVQSFVTALENEDDHVTDSMNGLHLGHDDDGEILNIHMFI